MNRKKYLILLLCFFSLALFGKSDSETPIDSMKIGLEMLHSRGMPDVLVGNLSKRLNILEKSIAENKLSQAEAEREVREFERSVIHYSSRYLGSYPLSPMFGANPAARRRAFERERLAQYSDWRRNASILRKFGLRIDAENEISRGNALKKATPSYRYVDSDPEYDQAIVYWKNVADEKFRLASQILMDEYKLDGIKKAIALRTMFGWKNADVKNLMKSIQASIGSSRWALNTKHFNTLTQLESKRLRQFSELEQAVFTADPKIPVIRPGVSFKSVGSVGFLPKWQSLPIFNVRNGGMFRSSKTDFIPYENMTLDWEVSFDISDAAYEGAVVKDGSWTYSHRINTYRGKNKEKYRQDCWWSVLAPGILFDAKAKSITVSDNTTMFPEAPAGYAAVFDGKVRIVKRNEPMPSGKMTEGWVLLFWDHSTLKNPVILFFEHAPNRFAWAKDGLRIRSNADIGRYAAGLLYGAASRPPDFGMNWNGSLPPKVIEQCRAVAAKLAFFPCDIDEFYAMDNGRVHIWDVLKKSFSLNRNWKVPAPPYLPVPPIYAFAVRCKVPYIIFDQKVSEPLLATRYGFYQTVGGNMCSYSLPLPDIDLKMVLKPIGKNAAEFVDRYNKHVRMISEAFLHKNWGGMNEMLNGYFLMTPELRKSLNFNPMQYNDAMASNQMKTDYTSQVARTLQNFWLEPQTGKSAVVSGWRGTNLGCELIGDSTFFNQIPVAANYGRAVFFGQWDLIHRNWSFLKSLYSAVPFNHVWQAPGMSCCTTGTVIFGDMLGDGYWLTVLGYRLAREMGDSSLANEALYLAAKQNAAIIAYLKPQVVEYNAHIKNLPSVQSDQSVQGQLGVDLSGFMTRVWLDPKARDYTSQWNSPMATKGCGYHTMLDNIFSAFSPEDTNIWLEKFKKAVPQWADTNYCLENFPSVRFQTKWGILAYLAENTTDKNAVLKLYDKYFNPDYYCKENYPSGIARNWKFPYYDYVNRISTLPLLIAQNDPVWLGDPGNARLHSGTYNREKRIAEITFSAESPSCLTVVSQLTPVSIVLDGKPVEIKADNSGYQYRIPYPAGGHRLVIGLPEYKLDDYKLPRRGVNGYDAGLGLKPMSKPRPFKREFLPADGAFKVGKCKTIDLRPFCNHDFYDQPASRKEKDVWLFPKGEATLRGVPFEFVDSDKNNGKSCLFLNGAFKKNLPRSITGIPVNCQARRIFFYHGLCHSLKNLKGKVLTYRIHFEDGQVRDIDCTEGYHVAEWKVFSPDDLLVDIPGALPSRIFPPGKKGQRAKGAGGYIFEWKNNVRKSGVTNQDTDQQGLAAVKSIDIISSGKAVPIVLAITVEE